MALVVHCWGCGVELDDVGGLFFGRPDRNGVVQKKHLCGLCTDAVWVFINSLPHHNESHLVGKPLPKTPSIDITL